MGCGVFTTFPQIANSFGYYGLFIYSFCLALPIFGFSFFGSLIRKKCSNGFILINWINKRYGNFASYLISFFSCFTMFMFIVAELASLNKAIESLTNLNPIPILVAECLITTFYTIIGGFQISFITEIFQSTLVLILILASSILIGFNIKNESIKIFHENFFEFDKYLFFLFYILFIAIITNDCFMSGFWLRTFASKSDKHLLAGCTMASLAIFTITILLGITGIISVSKNLTTINDKNGFKSFYIFINQMPSYIVGFVLTIIVILSTCTFQALQSALTSTIHNDFFSKKKNFLYSKIIICLITLITLIISLTCSNDILQLFLIADLTSSSVIPSLFLGFHKFFNFLNGFDIIFGSLASFFAVFLFGFYYYKNYVDGLKLLLLWNGIYNKKDLGPFFAFLIAPISSIVFTFLSSSYRHIYVKFFVKN